MSKVINLYPPKKRSAANTFIQFSLNSVAKVSAKPTSLTISDYNTEAVLRQMRQHLLFDWEFLIMSLSLNRGEDKSASTKIIHSRFKT